MKNILTASKVESLYKKPIPGQYADGERLYLSVSPKGVLAWRYRMELNGKKNWITFGRFPAVKLAHAREIASEYSEIIARGMHPKEYFERQKALNMKFSTLCEEYIQHQLPLIRKEGNSRNQLIRIINNELIPFVGNIGLNELTSEIIHKKIIQTKVSDSPAAVKRNVITIKQIMQYGIELGYTNSNPVDRIDRKKIYKDNKIERYLSFEELSLVLNALYKARIRTQWCLGSHLLILLLVRKNELFQATWDQVNFENAYFDLPENKTNRPTKVPLSWQSIKIFEKLKEFNGHSKYIFTGKSGNPVSHNALNQVIKFTEILLKEKYTIHDLRRTGASLLPKMGFDFIVVEAALNHEFRHGSSKHYFQHDYYPERAAMAQIWADKIDTLIEPKLLPYKLD